MGHIIERGFLRGDRVFPVAPANNTIVLPVQFPELIGRGEHVEGKWNTELTVILDSTFLGTFDTVMDFIENLRVTYDTNGRSTPYADNSFNVTIFDNTGQSATIHHEDMGISIKETLSSLVEYRVTVLGSYTLADPISQLQLPVNSHCLMHSFISLIPKSTKRYG
jgi:hypothetical protein